MGNNLDQAWAQHYGQWAIGDLVMKPLCVSRVCMLRTRVFTLDAVLSQYRVVLGEKTSGENRKTAGLTE